MWYNHDIIWSRENVVGIKIFKPEKMAKPCRWYFQLHFFNETIGSLISISMKVVPKDSADKSDLVQVIGWRLAGANSLIAPMMTKLYGATCVSRKLWGKTRDVLDVNFTGHQNIIICEYCSLSGDNLHLWIIYKVGPSSGDNLHLWIID